jgi:hypothetical protein
MASHPIALAAVLRPKNDNSDWLGLAGAALLTACDLLEKETRPQASAFGASSREGER